MNDAARPAYAAGDIAMVFDARAWNGRDVDDNSQFWKPARLVHVYLRDGDHGDSLATVEWPDGRVSGGHIVSMMQALSPAKPDEASP